MGRGLLAKALSLRNQAPPVPMSNSSYLGINGLSMVSSGFQTYMQAYASSGTVWQIAHLLSSSVAKPEWRLYRKTKTDGRVRYTTSDQGSDQRQEVAAGKHQALNVLMQPATIRAGNAVLPVWTRFGLFEISQLYLELCGESYWVVDYVPGTSIPAGLWPVRPDRMEPVPDPDRFLKGWCYTSPDGREKVPLEVADVIQVKYPNPMDPYRGLGPAQAVLVDIESARYSAEWNRNYFLNSAEPGGVIQVDHSMDDDEWNDLTNRWRESHRGVARAHRVAVLEAGQTWVQNAHSMRDMDFAALRNVSRDLIREAWGLHKIMLGNSDDVNRANAQTGEEVYANWSVAPRLDRWRDALNFQFLPLFGSTGEGVEFDYIYPLPQNREQDNAELTAKTEAWAALVGQGADPHDAAEVVGLPDMNIVEQATQAPALPPGWVPEQPAAADGGVENLARELAGFLARAKVSKESVNFRESAGAHRCGDCAMFHPDTASCDLVRGRIEPGDVCDRWTPKQDDMAALVRRVLSDGYVPVGRS